MGIDFGAPQGANGGSPADQVAHVLGQTPEATLAQIAEATGYRHGAVLDAIRALRGRGQMVTANPSPAGTVYRLEGVPHG